MFEFAQWLDWFLLFSPFSMFVLNYSLSTKNSVFFQTHSGKLEPIFEIMQHCPYVALHEKIKRYYKYVLFWVLFGICC